LYHLKGKEIFESVIEVIGRIGQLMMKHPEFKELDLNPGCIYPKGFLVPDEYIVLRNGFVIVSLIF
jgi:hypothetical protein